MAKKAKRPKGWRKFDALIRKLVQVTRGGAPGRITISEEQPSSKEKTYTLITLVSEDQQGHYMAICNGAGHPGGSPDEALGHAVRELVLAYGDELSIAVKLLAEEPATKSERKQ